MPTLAQLASLALVLGATPSWSSALPKSKDTRDSVDGGFSLFRTNEFIPTGPGFGGNDVYTSLMISDRLNCNYDNCDAGGYSWNDGNLCSDNRYTVCDIDYNLVPYYDKGCANLKGSLNQNSFDTPEGEPYASLVYADSQEPAGTC
ncbi:hypothetical protein KC316_g21467 [Hortaea werneckii]|nr:hypothetical protein KC324_g15452 [Hortaea werneckii]KAI7515485.1 hypothetical protein KC316_g21467 [Hortaea werneckii]